MVHFRPEYLVHFTPVQVVHIAPESLVHFAPVEVVHYTPVCSLSLGVINCRCVVDWECGADLSADTIEARWQVVGEAVPQMGPEGEE